MEFILLSVPYDLKSSLRQGAREGPQAIKAALFEEVFNPYSELGVNTREEGILIERGPVQALDNYLLFEEALLREVEKTRKDQFLISLGGDHSITYPLVKGMRKIHGKLNLVFLDSHPRLYPAYHDDPYSHGSVVSRIVEAGPWRSLHQIGIRASTALQRERASQFGVQTTFAWELQRAMGLSLSGPTYLSIDLDVLDPAFAPGVGNPVPGGLSTRQLFDFIHALDGDLVALDLCEFNPRWDRAGITALTAARTMMEVMGHSLLRRKRS